MSAEDDAFREAQERIEKARAEGAYGLDLTALKTLARLPEEIADLAQLQFLDLGNTQITDLAPLAALTGLQSLSLSNTRITDLAPLAALTGLRRLDLDNTRITDLRPIADLQFPKSKNTLRVYGLRFANTPAADATPDLKRLSEIEDNETRTRETLAYLRTLPPWPAPLPWHVPESPPLGAAPDAPQTDALPRLFLTADQRTDLAHSRATYADRADPIKERLYGKLPAALTGLQRYGNQYPELVDPLNALTALTKDAFGSCDLLDIDIEIAALSDLRTANAARAKAEQ